MDNIGQWFAIAAALAVLAVPLAAFIYWFYDTDAFNRRFGRFAPYLKVAAIVLMTFQQLDSAWNGDRFAMVSIALVSVALLIRYWMLTSARKRAV